MANMYRKSFFDPAEKLINLKSISYHLKRNGYYVGYTELPRKIAAKPSPAATKPKRELYTESLMRDILHSTGYRGCSYTIENNGVLVREVTPFRENRGIRSSHGSGVLDIHTEFPILPLAGSEVRREFLVAPDVLTLLCMRGDKSVPTGLVHVNSILSQLDQWTLATLQKPLFIHSSPPSYGASFRSDAKPILYLKNGEFDIQFNSLVAQSETKEGKDALAKLRSMLFAMPRILLRLKAGQFVIFNNRRILHERGAEIARIPHGRKRWLRRMYGIKHNGTMRPILFHVQTLEDWY